MHILARPRAQPSHVPDCYSKPVGIVDLLVSLAIQFGESLPHVRQNGESERGLANKP